MNATTRRIQQAKLRLQRATEAQAALARQSAKRAEQSATQKQGELSFHAFLQAVNALGVSDSIKASLVRLSYQTGAEAHASFNTVLTCISTAKLLEMLDILSRATKTSPDIRTRAQLTRTRLLTADE